MRFEAEPWKEIMGRDCKPCGAPTVAGADPGPAGTGALVGLILIAVAVFALEKRLSR
ncbi:MAG: hypothetical protein KGK07_13635 [Chloroflexota bacterium]|nr:hypothetical protein [Chloroflexota bacterium]